MTCTTEEAEGLVNRSMKVILSWETLEQLKNAVGYSNLVYRKLSREIGMINMMEFVQLIERSIGFAQCQIKVNTK